MKTPKLTKKQVADALKEHKGFSSFAAKSLGVHYRTVLRARQRWPELDVVAQDSRAEMVDIAEMKLFQQTEAGERWAVQFVLANLHPDYKEKKEIDLKTRAVGTVENLTDDELANIACGKNTKQSRGRSGNSSPPPSPDESP